MKDYSIAYAEVYSILETLGDKYKEKLPKKFIEYIKENRNKEYVVENITEDNISELTISRDALVILSLLNLNYWEEDDKEKARLLEIYKQNDEKKFGNYNSQDWLRDSTKKENNVVESNKPNIENEEVKQEVKEESEYSSKTKDDEFMIVVNENSIIYKVKKFIRKIINKWKKEK